MTVKISKYIGERTSNYIVNNTRDGHDFFRNIIFGWKDVDVDGKNTNRLGRVVWTSDQAGLDRHQRSVTVTAVQQNTLKLSIVMVILSASRYIPW